MNDKKVPGSPLIVSEERSESMYPMYFGVSCAFFALNVLTRPEQEEERWSELCHKMLQGSAQLLGLMVWRVQRQAAKGHSELFHKLENAEKEIEEIKKVRREDSRANEKVVGIFASQEQSWLIERKKLQQHIRALMNELRIVDEQRKEEISEMNDKLKEMDISMQFKGDALKEEQKKRKELEEKLKKAENVAEELRETAKREAKEYSAGIWKHKTAFLELVSNQHQLEAEISRALRQLEAKKLEFDSVLEQKEESASLAQKLSMEVAKMRMDLDQKDKILSAILRKSKQDTAEKQMLLKEVKLSKAKKKQGELHPEGWRSTPDSGRERRSLRSMFARNSKSRSDNPSPGREASQVGKSKSHADHILECENPEFQINWEAFSPLSDYCLLQSADEPTDVKHFDSLVCLEAEKYATAIEKRHHLEIEGLVKQMRLKDEKLEAFRWRLLSMEIESKRFQAHVGGLNCEVSQLRHENMKLEALLLDKQEELNELNKHLTAHSNTQNLQITISHSDLQGLAMTGDAISSKVTAAENKPMDRVEETIPVDIFKETEAVKGEETPCDLSQGSDLVIQSPDKDVLEKEVLTNRSPMVQERANPVQLDAAKSLATPSHSLGRANNSPWKMDLHALGVSYKIKRLKQQFLVLDRLTGRQESGEDSKNIDHEQNGTRSFLLLISLLNKHVSRYESLQEKTDELCKRMHDKHVDSSHGESSSGRKKEEMKTLEHFLGETFQLQRYMVATGQKLTEVQSKIASGFVGVGEELDRSVDLNVKCFADNVRTLLQEVQRGLEVRIARIIGDLEGTLACEGMIKMKVRSN